VEKNGEPLLETCQAEIQFTKDLKEILSCG